VNDLRSLKVPFDTGEILTALTEEESGKLCISQGTLETERLRPKSCEQDLRHPENDP
jgi:hypothetical protein